MPTRSVRCPTSFILRSAVRIRAFRNLSTRGRARRRHGVYRTTLTAQLKPSRTPDVISKSSSARCPREQCPSPGRETGCTPRRIKAAAPLGAAIRWCHLQLSLVVVFRRPRFVGARIGKATHHARYRADVQTKGGSPQPSDSNQRPTQATGHCWPFLHSMGNVRLPWLGLLIHGRWKEASGGLLGGSRRHQRHAIGRRENSGGLDPASPPAKTSESFPQFCR